MNDFIVITCHVTMRYFSLTIGIHNNASMSFFSSYGNEKNKSFSI